MPAHIGLIGGIGPAATDFYYRKIIAAYAKLGLELELTIAHADTPTLLDNLRRDNRQCQVDIYQRLTRRLATAGADFVVVTSIAGHFCIEEFKDKSMLPVIDLIEAVREEVECKRFKSLGILGTETVMRSALYGGLGGVVVATPSAELLTSVHEAYVAMATLGSVSVAQRETFDAACTELVDDFGVDAVLMGGTDLALVYDEATSRFPIVDCAAIHARKVVSVAQRSE
jgi:aspartate racemase